MGHKYALLSKIKIIQYPWLLRHVSIRCYHEILTKLRRNNNGFSFDKEMQACDLVPSFLKI